MIKYDDHRLSRFLLLLKGEKKERLLVAAAAATVALLKPLIWLNYSDFLIRNSSYNAKTCAHVNKQHHNKVQYFDSHSDFYRDYGCPHNWMIDALNDVAVFGWLWRHWLECMQYPVSSESQSGLSFVSLNIYIYICIYTIHTYICVWRKLLRFRTAPQLNRIKSREYVRLVHIHCVVHYYSKCK